MDMEDQPGDLTARLPDDVIADVLRRLAPRWLAASRCVCKYWRTVIDTRSLLQADLLPLSLRGIYVHFGWRLISAFFSRPAAASSTGGIDFSLLPSEREFLVWDHCNGLVLINKYVVNPATQRWDAIPEPPPDNHHRIASTYNLHLVFDPTVSPDYYEVIMVPGLPCSPENDLDLQSEWPPSPLVLRVFSSRSGRWEERFFVRQGNAAATVHKLCMDLTRFFSAYWRGSLYVHYRYFIMRISLSEHKYNVIRLPAAAMREDFHFSYHSNHHLGRSEKGVYLASLCHRVLHVWILNESCGQLEWILKGKYSLEPVKMFNQQVYGSWILQDSSYIMYGDHFRESITRKPECQDKFKWNSDDEDDDDDYCHTITNNVDVVDRGSDDYEVDSGINMDEVDSGINILGFHPYKEIIFLSKFEEIQERTATGLAFHLNKSKVEALGIIDPTHNDQVRMSTRSQFILSSFPYTPCWIGEHPRNSGEVI